MSQKLTIPLDVRYRKVLEDLKLVEEQLKEERRLRVMAEQRATDLEKSWPEHGLRFDRLEDENKRLRQRLERAKKDKRNKS